MERAGVILEEKLTNLIANKQYKELSDEEKMDIIQDFTTKARNVARAELTNELVGELKGEELRAELGRLKELGLVTRGVFSEWQRLYPI